MSTKWKTLLVDGFVRDIVQTITHITFPKINGLCFRFLYIDSVAELKKRRNTASTANDLELKFEIEKSILWQTAYDEKCNDAHDDKTLFYQETLQQVFNHWIAKKKINVFRETIVDATLRCIQNNNIKILEIILKQRGYHHIFTKMPGPANSHGYDFSEYDLWKEGRYGIELNNTAINNNNHYWRNNEIIQFINHSAKCASFDCIKLLLQSPNKINWEFKREPVFLLNAIKFNVDNIELINFIIEKLENLTARFVYDSIVEEAISNDLVDIVKTLINNRWHVITENNEFYAKSLNGECHKMFVERSNAAIMNAKDILNRRENVIDLDEWDNSDDNDELDDSHAFDFSEDDDWEKAAD